MRPYLGRALTIAIALLLGGESACALLLMSDLVDPPPATRVGSIEIVEPDGAQRVEIPWGRKTTEGGPRKTDRDASKPVEDLGEADVLLASAAEPGADTSGAPGGEGVPEGNDLGGEDGRRDDDLDDNGDDDDDPGDDADPSEDDPGDQGDDEDDDPG